MIELVINKKDKTKEISLLEDQILIEHYEENGEEERKEGNIYLGIVKDIIPGMQSAFINIGTEKNSFIHLKDILPKIDETKEKQSLEQTIIQKEIRQNQKLLVQVKKDSNEKKGARVSTHINLPSTYIVFMPDTDIVTISQKIEDKKEQERLIKIVRQNLSKDNGAIIRTSAENKKEQEIIEDIKNTEKKWNEIKQKYEEQTKNEPIQLYKSESIVEKIIIDLIDKKIEKIILNDKEDYEEIKKLKAKYKELKNTAIVVKDEENIQNIYDLEKQIEKSKNRRIWLKCGGFITIDKTEALTAIDVNTGKYTGNKNLNQTIYKVNEEATIEIAKQLRLRDIGGIIIIDYIDMKIQKDKEKIEKLLKECLKKDRTKTQVEGFTKLDLMEMTRKHICSHQD